MGSKRSKRFRQARASMCTDGEAEDSLASQQNVYGDMCSDGKAVDSLASQQNVCGDHSSLDACRQDNCENEQVLDGIHERTESCQLRPMKRARVNRPLVDLSEYAKFCLDTACTLFRCHLPCETMDAKSNGAAILGDSLIFSLSECSKSMTTAESKSHGLAKKQPQAHDSDQSLQGEHKISSHEQELIECKLKIMTTRFGYGVDIWSLAAQLVNPYEALPSVAIRALNRAFFKMWELMKLFPSLIPLPTIKPKLLSAHICEGPGGFIQAVRMFRSQNVERGKCAKFSGSLATVDERGTEDSWFAISLFSPESDNGDMKMQPQKIEDSMSKWDQGHVHYGADKSGNVLNPENIASFVKFVLKKTNGEKMHLITGDGAFDVSDDFFSQEQSHVHLVLCEILIAAQLQCQGGALVLKVFDCFTEAMATLVYILTLLYRRVEIVRLRTSRVCNSERFVVAQGFHALPKSLEDKFMSISQAWYDSAKDSHPSLKISSQYPLPFLEALNHGNAAIANIQSTAILQAVAVAENLAKRLGLSDA